MVNTPAPAAAEVVIFPVRLHDSIEINARYKKFQAFFVNLNSGLP
jgi:hypothetical protein